MVSSSGMLTLLCTMLHATQSRIGQTHTFSQAYISFRLLQKCLKAGVLAACELQASTSYLQPNHCNDCNGSSLRVRMLSSTHRYFIRKTYSYADCLR